MGTERVTNVFVPRVLCVDPDSVARGETADRLRAALADLDPVVDVAGTLAEATERMDAERPDCVVTEYTLPDGTGLDLADHTLTAAPDAVCVLFTATDPAEMDTERVEATITEYVPRSVDAPHDRLAEVVRAAVVDDAGASYPRPDDEPDRLAALAEFTLDDDDLRASLDRVTDLAVRHYDAASASVNIIGDHDQTFLACQQLVDEGTVWDRSDSVCAFTIVEDDPVMIVEDVQSDPRFESVAALADSGIRFYMGAQLTTSDGHAIGTLCVYDDEPRSAADGAFLQTLAELAMDLLERHRTPGDGGRVGP